MLILMRWLGNRPVEHDVLTTSLLQSVSGGEASSMEGQGCVEFHDERHLFDAQHSAGPRTCPEGHGGRQWGTKDSGKEGEDSDRVQERANEKAPQCIRMLVV